ncbi:MAG: entericidin [Bacteroidaceae bacterium]|nr:entericidin [Bacteroidaceae bacterium]
MKKLVFMFAAVVAVSFASCGGNTQNAETTADSCTVDSTACCKDSVCCDSVCADSVCCDSAKVAE